ncbi:MAG: glycosyltransferase family 2 protein [Gaiellaceae bacterium]
MNTTRLSYAAITPARNEADTLPRLAGALCAQTVRPTVWLVVENGSTDATAAVLAGLVASHDWVRGVETSSGGSPLVRGGTVTRAFQRGLDALQEDVDVVVKLDADVSVDPEHVEQLLGAFVAEPSLGMASGTCLELEDGAWVPRHATGDSVWGAVRAYRRACLADVLPLEEHMGWDGIDQLKANMRGWTTRTLPALTFRHHRAEGERDGPRRAAWSAQGRAAWYMGYRTWFLVLRALYHACREPSALAMIGGYARAALRREDRCAEKDVRGYLRSHQSVRALPALWREASGRDS